MMEFVVVEMLLGGTAGVRVRDLCSFKLPVNVPWQPGAYLVPFPR